MQFFSFWRSLASFRVRIALNLKGLEAQTIPVDIDAGAQRGEAYRSVNPQMALPTLVTDHGTALFQSIAILEYLEERYPNPPLLPADAEGRARARGIALMVACEGHPLVVPRVRRYLTKTLKLDEPSLTAWITHWTDATLATLEARLAGDRDTGRFCHGDTPTFADICLAGHLTFAISQNIDLGPYPTVKRVFENAMALRAFAQAHPLAQPETPEALRIK